MTSLYVLNCPISVHANNVITWTHTGSRPVQVNEWRHAAALYLSRPLGYIRLNVTRQLGKADQPWRDFAPKPVAIYGLDFHKPTPFPLRSRDPDHHAAVSIGTVCQRHGRHVQWRPGRRKRTLLIQYNGDYKQKHCGRLVEDGNDLTTQPRPLQTGRKHKWHTSSLKYTFIFTNVEMSVIQTNVRFPNEKHHLHQYLCILYFVFTSDFKLNLAFITFDQWSICWVGRGVNPFWNYSTPSDKAQKVTGGHWNPLC